MFEQVQSKGHGLIEEIQVETSADRLHTKHGLLVLVKRKDCDGFLRVGLALHFALRIGRL